MFFSKKKKETAQEPPLEPAEPADDKQERYLKEAQIREKLAEGWYQVLITFEIAGKPKAHVEETLKAYMTNIKEDERIKPITEDYAEPMKQDGGMYSVFCELETMVQDLDVLTWLSINFMPASIEILKPEKFSIEARYLQNWYNDLLSKLHETSNVLREVRSVNSHITQGMNALIKNGILAAVAAKPRGGKEIAQLLGMPEKQLTPFLNDHVEKARLLKEDGKYKVK